MHRFPSPDGAPVYDLVVIGGVTIVLSAIRVAERVTGVAWTSLRGTVEPIVDRAGSSTRRLNVSSGDRGPSSCSTH